MSNQVNDNILEEAAFYIDYFEGTVLGKILVADVEADDLDGLHHHLKDARELAFKQEYMPRGAVV